MHVAAAKAMFCRAEEDILGGNDFLDEIMLGLHQLFAHPAHVGAIDKGDGAGQQLIGMDCLAMVGERIADQFADQL